MELIPIRHRQFGSQQRLLWVGLLLTQVYASLAAESLRGKFQLLPEPVEITALNAITTSGYDYFERDEDTFRELIDDAGWIFSGMIYGYVVSWVPPFNARGVKEKLEIEPVAQIPAEDEKLKTLSADKIDGVVYVLVEYESDSTQQKRLEAWASPLFPFTAGEGSSPILGGSRREALKMAIKEAIRNYFREREFNRPQSIQTRVALIDFPQFGFNDGAHRVLVGIRMDLKSIRHYKID